MTDRWQDPEVAARFRQEAVPWNPTRPEQVEVLLHLVGSRRPARILDLGCGPGFLADALLDALPGVEIVACDYSGTMVARARERLGDRARVLELDLAAEWTEAGSGFDLVLAVQSVHHLENERKRHVLGEAYRRMRPGGLYLQSDPVAVENDASFRQHLALWNRARRAAGFEPLPENYDRERFEAQLRDFEDHLAPLGEQLRWLEETGFDPVECFWRYGNRAIFGGFKRD